MPVACERLVCSNHFSVRFPTSFLSHGFVILVAALEKALDNLDHLEALWVSHTDPGVLPTFASKCKRLKYLGFGYVRFIFS